MRGSVFCILKLDRKLAPLPCLALAWAARSNRSWVEEYHLNVNAVRYLPALPKHARAREGTCIAVLPPALVEVMGLLQIDILPAGIIPHHRSTPAIVRLTILPHWSCILGRLLDPDGQRYLESTAYLLIQGTRY